MEPALLFRLRQARCRPDAAGPAGGFADAGRREIVGDAALLLRAGRVDQPHQQEEGHHGGDEVGVGHLPGAAVMAAADDLLDLLISMGRSAARATGQLRSSATLTGLRVRRRALRRRHGEGGVHRAGRDGLPHGRAPGASGHEVTVFNRSPTRRGGGGGAGGRRRTARRRWTGPSSSCCAWAATTTCGRCRRGGGRSSRGAWCGPHHDLGQAGSGDGGAARCRGVQGSWTLPSRTGSRGRDGQLTVHGRRG
jgi:hypothetical protein